MEKIVKFGSWLLVALWAFAGLTSCKAEADASDLEFGHSTFESHEGEENSYISVYLMETPYKYPVVVDMEVEMLTGKNNLGEELTLDDVLEFVVTDQSYTVTKTGDRTAKIENVEVTYTNYNQKVYFNCYNNDYLQSETITIQFSLTKVDGTEMGNNKTTILTIKDDEKAPLVRVGYYDTSYEAPAEATNPHKGQFYMRLQKVGKYEYVASELFGLSRPRLLGIYDPAKNTITFDGTDYDHILWELEAPVNAFQNDTIWAANYNKEGVVTEILRLRGAGGSGTEPIVMTTESIMENARGELLSIDTPCGFDIYKFNATTNTAGAQVGIYDAMERSKSMTYSETDYADENTRSMVEGYYPTPLNGWNINN